MDEKNKIKYLSSIHSPNDVKAIPKEEMDALASEIRDELVRIVSQNGGHLASNLGVVELTLAIHRVFDTPKDHVIFDVGHQSYVHKMLTGRYERMESIRKAGGISGFPKISESEHDAFGAGHSSTSFSAALGFATADKLCGSDAYTVAIFGDGAYTGGMIHEALNNCQKDLKLIIILNENEMSISKNIGRFATNLSRIRASAGYMKTKRATGTFLNKIPLIGTPIFKGIRKLKMLIKNSFYDSNYFESMGLTYLGPIDGNNYTAVEKILRDARRLNESIIIHVKTKKGKGYAPAENEPSKYHGMPPSDAANDKISFSEVMGEHLVALANENDKICAITAAMSDGTGLNSFKAKHPNRFFDVGIAEEHALTFAAGLAANGMRPCAAIYSTFLQRAYDNIIHDVALQRLPVVFCVDRAGFNNADGATHHGIFDVAFTSQIPGIKIYAPVTYEGLRLSLASALEENAPSLIRYPAGGESESVKSAFYSEKIEKIGVRRDFSADKKPKILIITHGRIVSECLKAEKMLSEKNIEVGILLCEYLAPYDMLAIEISGVIDLIKPYSLIFVEEEIENGGFGVTLWEQLRKSGCADGVCHEIFAVKNPFAVRGEGESYLHAEGLDHESIAERIKKHINKK